MILEQTDNHYYSPLIRLFGRLVEMSHTITRLEAIRSNIILPNDYPVNITMSRLSIADITAPLFKGWELFAPTIAHLIQKDITIESEYQFMIRQQCTYYSAQCFEAFETFGKDVAFQHILFNKLSTICNKKKKKVITERSDVPEGLELYELIEGFCKPHYNVYSKSNYHRIDFKGFFCILSNTRHAITHSEGLISKQKYESSKERSKLIKLYFNLAEHNDEKTLISSDIGKLEKLIKHSSEIAYQIYKILSINDKLDWNIIPNYNFNAEEGR